MEYENPIAEYEKILGEFIPSESKDDSDDGGPDADGSDAPKPSWKAEVKMVMQLTDHEGKSYLVAFDGYKPTRPVQSRKEQPKKEPYKDSAILLKAVLKQNDFWGSTVDLQLEIQSENLRNLFKAHAKRYRELSLDADPIVIEYPFQCLFFLRERFQELSEDPVVPLQTRKELAQLLGFVEGPLGVQKFIEVYDSLVRQKRQITFRMLWSIFPPYSPVVIADPHEEDDVGSGYLLESIQLKDEAQKNPRWELRLLYGHHNGTAFGIRKITREISLFSGKKDISLRQLSIIPLHLVEEKQRKEMRDALIGRGKKYVKYCQADTTFLHYKGHATLTSSENNARLGDWGSSGVFEIDERVVLDRVAQHKVAGFADNYGDHMAESLTEYFYSTSEADKAARVKPVFVDRVTLRDLAKLDKSGSLKPDREPKPKETGMIDPAADTKPKKVELTDEDYFVCRSSTVAFALDQKTWILTVKISLLKEIEWHGDPFSSLQANDSAKRLVGRLVKGFNSREEDVYDDIIKGKGKGLIFLLHGPPGLGKTLTAGRTRSTSHHD
jgi:hypothetical protein